MPSLYPTYPFQSYATDDQRRLDRISRELFTLTHPSLSHSTDRQRKKAPKTKGIALHCQFV